MRTGVCHQIANRILAAAGVEIPLTSDPQVGQAGLPLGHMDEIDRGFHRTADGRIGGIYAATASRELLLMLRVLILNNQVGFIAL